MDHDDATFVDLKTKQDECNKHEDSQSQECRTFKCESANSDASATSPDIANNIVVVKDDIVVLPDEFSVPAVEAQKDEVTSAEIVSSCDTSMGLVAAGFTLSSSEQDQVIDQQVTNTEALNILAEASSDAQPMSAASDSNDDDILIIDEQMIAETTSGPIEPSTNQADFEVEKPLEKIENTDVNVSAVDSKIKELGFDHEVESESTLSQPVNQQLEG